MSELLRLLVRGYVYRGRMSNGAVFEFWSPSQLSMTEARKRLMAYANGDYVGEGELVYEKGDLEKVWEAPPLACVTCGDLWYDLGGGDEHGSRKGGVQSPREEG